jgi:hypothetical protein
MTNGSAWQPKKEEIWLYIGDLRTCFDETKIFVSVDPPDYKIAEKIFTKFMEDNNLCGKKPSGRGRRGALIIYSNSVPKEKVVKLERLLMEAGVKPKLLKSGERVPDRAIKGSMYLYYKYDGTEADDKKVKNSAQFYDSPEQVEYMDNMESRELSPTMRNYSSMDISGIVPIPESCWAHGSTPEAGKMRYVENLIFLDYGSYSGKN